ncbi:DUF4835 family protein [Flavobacterium sp.]|jgi:hypothetical protein|uniref:type IX secretion system protein PorD n=1 Tax=Flavobacterium sp. TaxID=239 RepID=UPI0037C12139
MRKLVCYLLLFLMGALQAQELQCEVIVNSDRVTNANPQVFVTLQKAVSEFVNNTRWTNKVYKQNERILCSMYINVSEYADNAFRASIQVQASRPVYNSNYLTPIFNYNDVDFDFRYIEFENLFYNPNSFDSNLVSVLAFYAYMILGIDADSYGMLEGTNYFDNAENIVVVAQSSGYKGWAQSGGNQNRFFLVNDMITPTFSPMREGFYQYHALGLDRMADDLKVGKEGIKTALATISKVHIVRPNAFLPRVFFDAKSDEIVALFSGGPPVQTAELVETLNRMSPTNTSKWSKIR